MNKVIIAIDPSYTNTGIAVYINGEYKFKELLNKNMKFDIESKCKIILIILLIFFLQPAYITNFCVYSFLYITIFLFLFVSF